MLLFSPSGIDLGTVRGRVLLPFSHSVTIWTEVVPPFLSGLSVLCHIGMALCLGSLFSSFGQYHAFHSDSSFIMSADVSWGQQTNLKLLFKYVIVTVQDRKAKRVFFLDGRIYSTRSGKNEPNEEWSHNDHVGKSCASSAPQKTRHRA